VSCLEGYHTWFSERPGAVSTRSVVWSVGGCAKQVVKLFVKFISPFAAIFSDTFIVFYFPETVL
jgi:hypothetical protein